MRIAKGAFYRHKCCLDMDIEIVGIKYLGPDYFKLKVNFVASRDHNYIFWPDANIKLYRKDLFLWQRVC